MQAAGQEVKAIILLELDAVFMHRLVKGEKSLFTSGTCKVAKLDNGNSQQPVYFLNINSFYYGIQPGVTFIRCVYQDTIAYVFPHFDNGLSAVSLRNDAQELALFEQVLSNAARLVDSETAHQTPPIRAAIEEHYPNLSTEQIYYPDNVKHAITSTGRVMGNVFAAVGGFFKGGVEKMGEFLNNRVAEGEHSDVAPETKARWQSIKSGTTKVFQVSADIANKIIDPVVNKTGEYLHSVQEKIDNSESSKLKYAKELVEVSGRAIGEAVNGIVKGGSEVGKELSDQSKKIITKKYGEDVVNTITAPVEEGEKKEQEGGHTELKEEKEADPQPVKKQASEHKKEEESNVRLGESSDAYPQI